MAIIICDEYKDILAVGNHYGVEVETTCYDAGIGTVLLGDGKIILINNTFTKWNLSS